MNDANEDKQKEIESYIKYLEEKPFRYYVSFSFPQWTNKLVYMMLVKNYIKYLNLYILKKRYSKHGQALNGIIFKESSMAKEYVKFHVIFADHTTGYPLPDYDRMKEILGKILVNVNRLTGNSSRKIKNLTVEEYVKGDVEKIFKECFEYHKTLDNMISSICPIDAEPISFYQYNAEG